MTGGLGGRRAAARAPVLVRSMVLLLAAPLVGCSGGERALGAREAGPAATATAKPGPTVTFRSSRKVARAPEPVRLHVPALGVRTTLERLGRDGDGAVEVPRDWQRAGWYVGSARPGEPGTVVVLGHVDSPTGPAVFARLRSARPGTEVLVERRDGTTVRYRVDRHELHAKARFPTLSVYYPTLEPGLWLVTCDGPYVRSAGGYQANLLVHARPVGQP